MRKAVAAVTAGLLLVGGQAAAAGSNSAVSRVGDRIGARSGETEQLLGVPLAVLLIGSATVIATIIILSDEAESA